MCHDGVDGALVRLLARRGIDDPQELYLCGDGGSPGRLHNLEGVFFGLAVGDDITGESLLDNGRDFLVEVSFTLEENEGNETTMKFGQCYI